MVDQNLYDGREPAYVKHTFLERYIRDMLPKVSQFKSFVYVDLFAGPWKSRCQNYSDTSFGIALSQMAEAKKVQKRLGRKVQMVAHLVEKDAHEELKAAVSEFSGIDEIHVHAGTAEHFAPKIANSLPRDCFRFVVIDPKGLPDMRKFQCLVAPDKTEVLINFMFEFANRFAHTDRLPKLEAWLSELNADTNWKAELSELKGDGRERFITRLATNALAAMGQYRYAPWITVDESEVDRSLYKLIYLSRHPAGISVFRDAQSQALSRQSAMRSDIKIARTGQAGLFDKPGEADPFERSGQLIERERHSAEHVAYEIIKEAGSTGILWEKLWPQVLELWLIRRTELAQTMAKWQKHGRIKIEGWGPKRRSARDGDLIRFEGPSESTA